MAPTMTLTPPRRVVPQERSMQLKTANGDVAKLAAPGEIKAGGLSREE